MKKIKKGKSLILVFYMLSLSFLLIGCREDEVVEKLQEFITTQVSCETYKEAQGDEVAIKKAFETFFTEESYEKYLDDVVGYMYPQLYYITNADHVKIKSILCKEIKSTSNKHEKIYNFEVNYIIIPSGGKSITMRDYTQITADSKAVIKEVILLNTSDIIGKLFLDIKVQ